jgi:hypothetical protein
MAPVFLTIALPFCLIAGLVAFLITYDEYSKHGFKGKRLFREAFEAAIIAFLVMLGLIILASYFFP